MLLLQHLSHQQPLLSILTKFPSHHCGNYGIIFKRPQPCLQPITPKHSTTSLLSTHLLFFPTIWRWIKGWFDEGTRRKIHVLGRDPGSTLLELVDAHNLPTPYGGELQWKYGDEPNPDDETRGLLSQLPKGPVIFVNGANMAVPPP